MPNIEKRELSQSLLSAADIDECEVFGTCPQVCKNTKGGYDCECSQGYRKVGNGNMCEAEGEQDIFIYVSISNLSQYKEVIHLTNNDGMKYTDINTSRTYETSLAMLDVSVVSGCIVSVFTHVCKCVV